MAEKAVNFDLPLSIFVGVFFLYQLLDPELGFLTLYCTSIFICRNENSVLWSNLIWN